MTQLKKDLQSMVKTLNALAAKIDAISKKMGGAKKAKSAPKKVAKAVKKVVKAKPVKKSAPKKKAAPITAADTVLKIVSRYKRGIKTAGIKEKTGYNSKKVQNIVFKLRKQRKIKSAVKGVYVKA
ncbi:MAG: hypothetical protein QGE94_10645 [Desulfobacterales bacterium]|nr:hypothetical protein [Desulfobacterales bacterium]